MFFVPGIIISIVTFPGVIVHELAHQLFCRWFKVPVFKVVYFQTKNPVGYVLHEQAKEAYQSVFISVGPFIINTVLCFIIGFSASLPIKFGSANPLDYVLMYLAIAIGAHAFPSIGDAKSMWYSVVKSEGSSWFPKIIVTPIVGFIYLGAFGRMFWLDLIYGGAIALGLPYIIIKFMA